MGTVQRVPSSLGRIWALHFMKPHYNVGCTLLQVFELQAATRHSQLLWLPGMLQFSSCCFTSCPSCWGQHLSSLDCCLPQLVSYL
jgi:hypothetical protein